MKALWLESAGSLQLVDLPTPLPDDGEALVKVHSVGICGSDLSIFTGTHPTIDAPVVMGHEVFGVVEAVADGVTSVVVGQPVSVLACIGCGDCPRCDEGATNLCPRMSVIGGHRQGGLAEYVAVPEANIVALPIGSSDPLLALTEPAAVAHHATATIPDDRLGKSTVVVYGLGAVGHLLAQILVSKGTRRVYGVDPRQQARDAVARHGVITAPPKRIESVIAEVGAEIDIVFECSGNGRALEQALSVVRNGGETVLVGIQHEPMEIDWVRVQRYEKLIRGVQMYRADDFEAVERLIAERKLAFREIGAELVNLSEAPEVFTGLSDGRLHGKYVISTDEGDTR